MAEPALKRTVATGWPVVAVADADDNVPTTSGCASNAAGGVPALSAAAISAGGAPNVGLPTRAIDRLLGLGRVARGRIVRLLPVDGDIEGAAGRAGRELNCGGRETGGVNNVDPAGAAGIAFAPGRDAAGAAARDTAGAAGRVTGRATGATGTACLGGALTEDGDGGGGGGGGMDAAL